MDDNVSRPIKSERRSDLAWLVVCPIARMMIGRLLKTRMLSSSNQKEEDKGKRRRCLTTTDMNFVPDDGDGPLSLRDTGHSIFDFRDQND